MATNYVNNKQLYAVLKEYKDKLNKSIEEGTSKPPLPRYVAEAIMLISERLARKPQFFSYSFREDLTADAQLACIKYIDNFNPDKYDNPFAYITQIAHNAFVNRINVEHKQNYIRAVILKNTSDVNEDENFTMDSINGVIDSFENKMQKRRDKAAERAAAIKEKKQEEKETDETTGISD